MSKQIIYPVFRVESDGRSFTSYNLQTLHRTEEGAIEKVKQLQGANPKHWYDYTKQEVME